MKFRLTPKAVATLKGQGGAADASGLIFPLLISGPWSDLSILPDLGGGIENLLKDPEGALDAVKGTIDSLSNGSGLDCVADDALKAVTGAAAGGAALGGAMKLLEGVMGGGSDASDPLSNVLKSLGCEQARPEVRQENKRLTKVNLRIDETKVEMAAAKAAGDKKRLKEARQKLKKLRAYRDKIKAGG